MRTWGVCFVFNCWYRLAFKYHCLVLLLPLCFSLEATLWLSFAISIPPCSRWQTPSKSVEGREDPPQELASEDTDLEPWIVGLVGRFYFFLWYYVLTLLDQPHRAAVEVHQHPLVRVHVEALRVLNLKLIREQGLERRNKLNHHLPAASKSMINICSLQMLFSFLSFLFLTYLTPFIRWRNSGQIRADPA